MCRRCGSKKCIDPDSKQCSDTIISELQKRIASYVSEIESLKKKIEIRTNSEPPFYG